MDFGSVPAKDMTYRMRLVADILANAGIDSSTKDNLVTLQAVSNAIELADNIIWRLNKKSDIDLGGLPMREETYLMFLVRSIAAKAALSGKYKSAQRISHTGYLVVEAARQMTIHL